MTEPSQEPRVGISACLMGHEVRFDGGHKKLPSVGKILSDFVQFVPICPEFEAGLGVPRESMRLVQSSQALQVLGNQTGTDYSEPLHTWIAQQLASDALNAHDGFVLKKNSPSCGVRRVKLYTSLGNQQPARTGVGMFAAALQQRYPLLPLIEEGELNDLALQSRFLERLFFHHRWRTHLQANPSARKLVAFHSDHKLLYMAHSIAGYRKLGQIVAAQSSRDIASVVEEYARLAMETLNKPTSHGKHVNVLQHAMGYFKRIASDQERHHIDRSIAAYQRKEELRTSLVALLRQLIERYMPDSWLSRQHYFAPYPSALSAALQWEWQEQF